MLSMFAKSRRSVWAKLFFIAWMSLFLVGCGFHLRDYSVVPPQMHTVDLEIDNPFSPFGVQLRRNLQSLGIAVSNLPGAPVTLQILSYDFTQNLTNISTNSQVRTYVISYTVSFQLKNPRGIVIYGPQTVVSSMPYNSSDTQLLADEHVLFREQNQLREAVVTQIFDRLNSADGRRALENIP